MDSFLNLGFLLGLPRVVFSRGGDQAVVDLGLGHLVRVEGGLALQSLVLGVQVDVLGKPHVILEQVIVQG